MARYALENRGNPGMGAGAPAAEWVPKGPVSVHAFGARLQSAPRMSV
jgi:hypothetical protein